MAVCQNCKGKKKCPTCSGGGKTSMLHTCKVCGGTKLCQSCGGSGKK